MDDPQREFAKGPKSAGGPRLHQSDWIRRAVLVSMVGVSLAWLGGSPHAEEAPLPGQSSGRFPTTGVNGPGGRFGADPRAAASASSVSRDDRSEQAGGESADGEGVQGLGVGGQGLGVGGPAPGDVSGAEVSRVASAGEVIGFSHVDGSGSQRITLVNTGKSWMAVYHIDRAGAIRLVSSRPIDADFSLQLNATSPLPEEIRQMAGPSR